MRIVNRRETRKTESRTNTLQVPTPLAHMAHTATPTAHRRHDRTHTRRADLPNPRVLLLSTLVVVSTCRVYRTL